MGAIKSLFSSPKPPDPTAGIQQQTSADVNTAIANAALQNPTIVGPQGTVRYEQTGSQFIPDGNAKSKNAEGQRGYTVPTYTQFTELTKPLQQAEEANQQTQLNLANFGQSQTQRANELLASPLSFDGAPARGNLQGFNTNYRSQVQGASADRIAEIEAALGSRVNRQLGQDKEGLEAQLAAQGVRPGSEAYARAMQRFGDRENDAMLQTILAARQEDDRLFAQDLQRTAVNKDQAAFENQSLGTLRDVANQDRANVLNERSNLRNQNINEISALLNGSQVSIPQITPQATGVPGVDVLGSINQNYANQIQQQQQKNQLPMGLLQAGAIVGGGALARGFV